MRLHFGRSARALALLGLSLSVPFLLFKAVDGYRAFELNRMVPGLDRGFVAHVFRDNDPAFRTYCRLAGRVTLSRNYSLIDWALWSSPDERHGTRFRALAPHLRRVAEAYAVVFQSTDLRDDLAHRTRLGPQAIHLNHAVLELHAVQADAVGSIDSKLNQYVKLVHVFERFHYERGIVAAEAGMAREAARAGHFSERRRLLQSALDRARRIGDDVMICQLLGELGYELEGLSQHDSAVACYLDGIARADRHCIPEQAARLRFFLANYYFRQGRLSLASRWLRDAQMTCRRFGGGPSEIRAVFTEMEYFAELGCWDIVEAQLDRLSPLLRAGRRLWRAQEMATYEIGAAQWGARVMVEQGHASLAAVQLDSLLRVGRPVLEHMSLGTLIVDRARASLAAGRPAEALMAAREGLGYTDSFNLVRPALELVFLQASAAIAVRDLDLADSALAHARRFANHSGVPRPFDSVALGALSSRIELARGHTAEASRRFNESYLALCRDVRQLDPGPHSQLALRRAATLRDLGHELLAHDAAKSLWFELSWRSLPGSFGRRQEGLGRGRPRARERREDERTIHLVFGRTPDGLVRWSLGPDGIRRDLLASNPAEIDRLVDRTVPLLALEPERNESTMPDSLRRLLVQLGRLLIPPEVRSRERLRVLVSAEGALARLPFECLDTGQAGTYEPLLERHDVVYARPVPWMAHPDRPATTALLMGANDSERSPMVEGPAALEAIEAEAAQVRIRFPGVEVFRCATSSKQSVLDVWTRASFVYIAAHLVRDRDLPLLCHFPMNSGVRRAHPEDSSLDLLDVRSADLSGCQLAVLSSCASGEPYVVGDRSGPSMADAVVDAGSAAVIHTRWRVRDDQASVVAPALATAWIQSEQDPVAALCRERRASIRGASGWRHPFYWGAWSATIAWPTEPWELLAAPITARGLRAPAGPASRAASSGPSQ